MKSIFATALFAVSLTAGAQGIYQFKDPGFDSATGSTTPYNEWYSFESASTNGLSSFIASIAKKSSPKPSFEEGYDGTGKCIKIYSKYLVGKNANGNLTTGRVNMGSTDPKDTLKNYNYTNTSGSTGKCLFAGRPDAVSFYAKLTSGGSPEGRGQFILHDDYAYQDPELEANLSHRIGKAAILILPSTGWVYYEGAFTYDKAQTSTQYLLASFTTNPEPGGSANDYLWIDEVRFHYYHCLKNLAYGGTAISPTEGDTLKYDLSTQVYDESKLTFDKVGVGATVEKSYDSETGILTLTVKGNDFEADNTSKTEYTLQFLPCKTYDEKIVVTVNGESLAPIDASVILGRVPSASTGMFSLKNFMLVMGEDDALPVGNITLNGVTMEDKDGYTALSTKQTINIEAGDDSSVEWFGPGLGDVPIDLTGKLVNGEIRVNIDINMSDEMVVNVVMSNVHDLAINGIETLTQPEQPCIYKVRVCRQFKQGWNTYCMPVSVSLSDLPTGVTAQQFSSASDGKLSFSAVADGGTLAPGTPYLVYFPEAATSDVSLYSTGFDLDTEDVTYGDYTFKGNYVSGFSMNGLYGVVSGEDGKQRIMLGGEGSTLPATCAYFSTSSANAQGMLLNLEGEVTGITDAATTPAAQQGAVYSLQGVKVSHGVTQGLPAGIYVQHGRKVIIK